jgi:hypothetical protein
MSLQSLMLTLEAATATGDCQFLAQPMRNAQPQNWSEKGHFKNACLAVLADDATDSLL